MPIIAKTRKTLKKREVTKRPRPSPSSVVQKKEVVKDDYKPESLNLSKPKPKIEEKINNKYYFDPTKTYLVVNGIPKEISGKSKYLLDMLIIEEE